MYTIIKTKHLIEMNRLTKLLFLVTSILIGQDNSLILTGISRPNANYPNGTSGNTARSIEIYISEDIENLSLYGCATSNTINSADNSQEFSDFRLYQLMQEILFT